MSTIEDAVDAIEEAKRVKHLEERDDFLSCLEAMGVDNWCGYEEAQQMYEFEVDL